MLLQDDWPVVLIILSGVNDVMLIRFMHVINKKQPLGHLLTVFPMSQKCKHDHSSPGSIRAIDFSFYNLSDTEVAPSTQTNDFIHATHDSHRHTATQTIHNPFVKPEDPLSLDAIYTALDNDNKPHNELHNDEAPLDDNRSPSFEHHIIDEDCNTVSLLIMYSCHSVYKYSDSLIQSMNGFHTGKDLLMNSYVQMGLENWAKLHCVYIVRRMKGQFSVRNVLICNCIA